MNGAEFSPLQRLVLDAVRDMGEEKAVEFFSVSHSLIRQWVNGSKVPSLAAVEKVYTQHTSPGVTTSTANWEGKEVFLAIPCYKSLDPRTAFSILGIWDRAKFGASLEYGDAYVIHSRNNLAHKFKASAQKEILWLDDDMIVPCGNAQWFNYTTGMNLPESFAGLHAPTRLRSHGKTLVGGLYFGRSYAGKAIYYEAMIATPEGERENAYAHHAPKDELRPCWWTGTGCLWHTKDVLLDIDKAFPHLAPQFPNEPWHYFSNSDDVLHQRFGEIEEKMKAAELELKNGNGGTTETILRDISNQMGKMKQENLRHSMLQQGEDQTFGKRAKVAGHQSYVDLGVVCGHVGTAVYGVHNTRIR